MIRSTGVWDWMVRTFSSWCVSGNCDDAGAGIVEDEGSLLGSLRGIDGNCDGSEGEGGEVGGGPLRAIFAEDGDAVALADAP